MKYDLVVIGGGPGGYTGAIRAAKLGMKTALIEERDLGGTCLNRGCIPTKALLHSGEVYASRGDWAELGITAENVTLDEDAIYRRKNSIVENLRNGVKSLVKANQIDLYETHGTITGAHTVKAGDEVLETEYILIATGSVPVGSDPARRPIPGMQYALNSDQILAQKVEGQEIAVIGAGVIGVEFTDYLSNVGRNVTLIEPMERIIPMMNKDTSVQLASILKRKGVKIITGAKVNEILPDHTVKYSTAKGDSEQKFDNVIVSIGRAANFANLGLDSVGITAGRRIEVDDNMYTGVAGIYACGDAVGRIQLAHFAAASAITAVESMLKKPHSMDLNVVPSCIYTQPEIAFVGKKEDEVQNAKVGKFLMAANGKSQIEGVGRGFVKVVADENDTVVGAELFCVRGTDIIGELALAISRKMKLCEVASVIHPHPTVMEAVGESYEDIEGLSTHMSPKRK
ncbi:MAG: dihydrolipoyl dehydrogenase [Clostridiales bacterium]|nr:dihydrolipoyl dehydrogenase [Clostridiales bacterium]